MEVKLDNNKEKNKDINKKKSKDSITEKNENKLEYHDDSKDDKKKKALELKKSLLSWAIIIIVAFLLAKAVTVFVVEKVRTPTGSMEPTIMTTDRLLLFKLAYLFSDPERGDIVVIKDPSKPEKALLKRIVGLPGETISFEEGFVYIDGTRLEEKYLDGVETFDKGTKEYQIPDQCYFVMGDNRGSSIDSRAWEDPMVHKKYIEGEVFFRFSPSFEFIK